MATPDTLSLFRCRSYKKYALEIWYGTNCTHLLCEYLVLSPVDLRDYVRRKPIFSGETVQKMQQLEYALSPSVVPAPSSTSRDVRATIQYGRIMRRRPGGEWRSLLVEEASIIRIHIALWMQYCGYRTSVAPELPVVVHGSGGIRRDGEKKKQILQ
jgi:hypothetical protein